MTPVEKILTAGHPGWVIQAAGVALVALVMFAVWALARLEL